MRLNLKTASREELCTAYLMQQSKIEQLEIFTEWLKRQVFGQKSEHLIPQDPKQSTLFEVPEEPPTETSTIKSYERSARKNPTDTDQSEKILEFVRQLFEFEQNAKNLDGEEILQLRRTQSFCVVEQLFNYLNQLWFDEMIEQASLLGKAIAYARNREKQLRQFLEHPDIPISNNHVECSIRPVALGRKNWLFCWSEVGAKYAAIAFTIIESCKLANINPWDYISDVLVRIDSHPARDIHQLTPQNWKNRFL